MKKSYNIKYQIAKWQMLKCAI